MKAMDVEKLKLISKGGEYLCPLCLKKGQKNAIMAYQLNLYEAFYNCSSLKCHFPTFSKKYYIPPFQRHYLNMYEPIKYPQVYYGPLPYFEGVTVEEDKICSDDDDDEKHIQNLLPEKQVPPEKISSEEVDSLLDEILQDLKKTEEKSQQVCPENVLGVVGVNHTEPNFNSGVILCDVGSESQSGDQKTFCSSEPSHNTSEIFDYEGLQDIFGVAVSPKHLNDGEVPNSVGGVFVSSSDFRVSFTNHDISQTCETSAVTGTSGSSKDCVSFPVRNLDQKMDSAASDSSKSLPASLHSFFAKRNPAPTSFAPFEFTNGYKKRKPKRNHTTRKRKRKN